MLGFTRFFSVFILFLVTVSSSLQGQNRGLLIPETRFAKQVIALKTARVTMTKLITFRSNESNTNKYFFVRKFILTDTHEVKIDSGLYLRSGFFNWWRIRKKHIRANHSYLYQNEIPYFLNTCKLILKQIDQPKTTDRQEIIYTSAEFFQVYAYRNAGKKQWNVLMRHNSFFKRKRSITLNELKKLVSVIETHFPNLKQP